MFTLILTLCTYASCNAYYVDSAATQVDCLSKLSIQSDKMSQAWDSDSGKRLDEFLKSFDVVEQVELLQAYDYTCEIIPKEGDTL